MWCILGVAILGSGCAIFAWRSHRKVEALSRTHDVTLEALADSMALKDTEWKEHGRRVSVFAIAIARLLQLNREQTAAIGRAGVLHDIGKLSVPDAIVFKTTSLDAAEMKLMKEHCLEGFKMLRTIPWLKESADFVYYHHERYDGSGYPKGLRGEDIPLGVPHPRCRGSIRLHDH